MSLAVDEEITSLRLQINDERGTDVVSAADDAVDANDTDGAVDADDTDDSHSQRTETKLETLSPAVLGYDLKHGVVNDSAYDEFLAAGAQLPDVVLVRKSYAEKRRARREKGYKRAWKLKQMAMEVEDDMLTSKQARVSAEHWRSVRFWGVPCRLVRCGPHLFDPVTVIMYLCMGRNDSAASVECRAAVVFRVSG